MNTQPPALAYRLLTWPLFFFWLIHALLHGLKHRQLDYFWQRMGFQQKGPQRSIWIHASSVGEVSLIKPLVEHYCRSRPVMVTTFTASGLQHARRILSQDVTIRVLPIDCYPISRRFIRRHGMILGIIAETELWPETLYQARVSKIPLLQVNARLTSKSLDKAGWMKRILGQTLNYFDALLTRNNTDSENLRSLSVAEQKIHVCGNLKYAQHPEQHTNDLADLIGRPYILFASTREGEESLFAKTMITLQQDPEIQDPARQLAVIAPRHPQRATQIKQQLQALGIALVQRSKGGQIEADTDFYLADTLGELNALMAHARLVVMGGSFADIGGHNILEPARLGKAVITGPSDYNIRADIDLLAQHQAIIQVADDTQLLQQLKRLLTDPTALQQLADHARDFIQLQGDVLEHYIQQINRYLPDSTP